MAGFKGKASLCKPICKGCIYVVFTAEWTFVIQDDSNIWIFLLLANCFGMPDTLRLS